MALSRAPDRVLQQQHQRGVAQQLPLHDGGVVLGFAVWGWKSKGQVISLSIAQVAAASRCEQPSPSS
jgi:hypothetical protein